MSKVKKAGFIELKGSANKDHRIAFITTLLNNAESKVNHFDSLRQRNLVIALAVFAGLFGFTLRAQNDLRALFPSAALTMIISIFMLLDYRLHKYSQVGKGRKRRWFEAYVG